MEKTDKSLCRIYYATFLDKSRSMRRVTPAVWEEAKKIVEQRLWELHADRRAFFSNNDKYELRKLFAFLIHRNRKDECENYREYINRMVEGELHYIYDQPEPELFLQFLKSRGRRYLTTMSIADIYQLYDEKYRADRIRARIMELVQTDPEEEFPETREMKRRFILHVGPTNSGKTYEALEDLKRAKNGVYAGPLRLLALEVYEKLNDQDVPCTMLTGEEFFPVEDSRVLSATVEMVPLQEHYDIAVIDEAQMIADEFRGGAWTKLILGLQADKIHICCSPDALVVVQKMIELCQDKVTVKQHERKTPLEFERIPCHLGDVQEGDALIVFSKKDVLDIAARLEQNGVQASVIYGNLPPEVRRRQVELFADGTNKVVVSTDAIGMGINLPIRRIVFMQTQKYDGKRRRELFPEEVRQIAGRAGRYGIYDKGYVTASDKQQLGFVRSVYGIERTISTARLDFPVALLDLNEKLDKIIEEWSKIQSESDVFVKADMSEVLLLLQKLEDEREWIDGYDDKYTLYRMATCDIDIKNSQVIDLWMHYCRNYSSAPELDKPSLQEIWEPSELETYETYYKQLGLYHQFSTRFGKQIEETWVRKERADTEERIMQELLKNKDGYMKKCRYCGKELPMGYSFGVCDQCHGNHGNHGNRGRTRHGRKRSDGYERKQL